MADTPYRDTTFGRRVITVPAVLFGALLIVPLTLVIVPAVVLWDLIRARLKFPTLRVFLFGLAYLLWEVVAVFSAVGLWIASGFGLLLKHQSFERAHQQLQVVWARSHMKNLQRLLGLRIEITGEECLAPGPILLFSRHASMIDTLLPIHLTDPHGLACRYVLKNELLWDPALDLIGHRFPNYFVDRSGGNSGDAVTKVGELAAGTRANEAFVIFPEGSRFTESKRERALEKLRAADEDLAARAEKLDHTMPPRTGGPVAALARRPEGADVVFLAHTGFEGLAGVKDLIRAVPFRKPLQIELWRVSGDEIPNTDAARLIWLYERWADVNAWVGDHQR